VPRPGDFGGDGVGDSLACDAEEVPADDSHAAVENGDDFGDCGY